MTKEQAHNDILTFLKEKRDVVVQDYFEFPNKYGDSVSDFYIKYDIEDSFNYNSKSVSIDHTASVVFIPNLGYFPFKTIADIKNIINEKTKLL